MVHKELVIFQGIVNEETGVSSNGNNYVRGWAKFQTMYGETQHFRAFNKVIESLKSLVPGSYIEVNVAIKDNVKQNADGTTMYFKENYIQSWNPFNPIQQ